MSDEFTMSVSPVCGDPGKMYAYVRFEDGKRSCEWRFPNPTLSKNDGFSDEELAGLKLYIQNNMKQLKKMAASVNVFDAFRK